MGLLRKPSLSIPHNKKAITHPRQQSRFPSSLIHPMKNEQDPSHDQFMQEAIFTQIRKTGRPDLRHRPSDGN